MLPDTESGMAEKPVDLPFTKVIYWLCRSTYGDLKDRVRREGLLASGARL